MSGFAGLSFSMYSIFRRVAVLVLTGGCLLQVGGCAAGLTPVYLSLAESTILSALMQYFISP